jgi:hypothetical protein
MAGADRGLVGLGDPVSVASNAGSASYSCARGSAGICTMGEVVT